MVKHTQKICQQSMTNCLSVFDHFMGLMGGRLKLAISTKFWSVHFLLERLNFNSFVPDAPFLYLLKTLENLRFSGIDRG